MSSPLALTVPGALTGNYQGLWWNSPAGSESGWGINLTHQGDRIFATWFTYDTTGKEWWLAMSAPSTAMNTFSGILYQTRGPPFDAAPFNPADVTVIPVGLGRVRLVRVHFLNLERFRCRVDQLGQLWRVRRILVQNLRCCHDAG